jgi:hypothetical protein
MRRIRKAAAARARRNPAFKVSAGVLLVLGAWAVEQGRVSAQSRSLEAIPIVGHWEHQTEAGEAIVTVDATKWDRQLKPDFGSIGRQLFKTPAASFATNASSSGAFPVAAVRGVEGFTGGSLRVQFKMVGGASVQIAGLVFDLRDTGEYHVVRYNTKDGNVALWKFAEGARASPTAPVTRSSLCRHGTSSSCGLPAARSRGSSTGRFGSSTRSIGPSAVASASGRNPTAYPPSRGCATSRTAKSSGAP